MSFVFPPTRYGLQTLLGVLSMLVIGRVIAERAADLRGLRALTRVGKESIVYYTSHWIAVAAAAHLLHRAGLSQPTIVLAILLTAGFGVGWIFCVLRRRVPLVGLLFEFPPAGGVTAKRASPPNLRK